MELTRSWLIFFGLLLSASERSVIGREDDIVRNEASGEMSPSNRHRRETGGNSDSYFYYEQTRYPRDCQEVQDQCSNGETPNGIYVIKPDGYPEPFDVYCNNTIDDGGWTVFQRRVDDGVNFNRAWNDYKMGFGFPHREFWLGNDKISALTNQDNYELRIDFVSKTGLPFFAKYTLFRISDEGTNYKLVGLGEYNASSTANNDANAYHRGRDFSTHDRDNDASCSNCASSNSGAWWYGNCYHSELNRLTGSIYWYNFPGGNYNIQYTEMKIRPRKH